MDCVIGGSPCQDLSIAGKREGLAGARSGLFMEQIRIVKEMREADRLHGRTGQSVRPRYMVWENVPGAFSSNGGEDFRAVLEETIRIAEPDAPNVPLPPKGKWPLADAWYGDGWSVAYRVLDAQFWGVPQRRRRIALVADFGGQSAPEILFERQSMSWHTPQSGETGQGITPGVESGAYPTVARSLTARYDGSPCIDRGPNIIVQDGVNCLTPWDTQSARVYGEDGAWHSLNANENGGMSRDAVFCLQGNGIDRADTAGCNGKGWKEDISYTLNTIDRPAVFDARGNGNGETVPTITGDHENRVTDYTAVVMAETRAFQNTGRGWWNESDIGATLRTPSGGDATKANIVKGTSGTVRRLTPLECERLQGFPDGWTDIGEWTDSKGKVHQTSDAARYKAMGNSIALPPWKWVLKRLCACYERDATMASLFDGVGGFPLIWERLNGPGTCLWASEIEPFCVAVTTRHFNKA